MRRRRTQRLRIAAALLAALVTLSIFSTSTTRGGPATRVMGAEAGSRHQITGLQLEWNRGVGDPAPHPRSLLLTVNDGETFHKGDSVDVTAEGPDASLCSTDTTVEKTGADATVAFTACAVNLWDLAHVAVTISRPGIAPLRSSVGNRIRGLVSFDGTVVEPDAPAATTFATQRVAGVELLSQVRLEVGDATVDELVGRRLMTVLSSNNQMMPMVSAVGTPASNQGVWVEQHSPAGPPAVVADLAVLTNGRTPVAADVARYQMVLMQPQHLGEGEGPHDEYAILTAGATLRDEQGDAQESVEALLETTDLDDQSQFSAEDTPATDTSGVSLCDESNPGDSEDESLEWAAPADTIKPLLNNLDPTCK